MVYYDDGTRKKHYRYKRRERKWLSISLAFIMGAFLFAVALPYLSDTGLLPYAVVDKETLRLNAPIEQVRTEQSGDLTDMIAHAIPMVVGIENIGENFLGLFPEQSRGTGSGVIYKLDETVAHIVTNHHVVDGANDVRVVLNNGERLAATVLGTDPFTDLAVIRVERGSIDKVMPFGDSDLTKVGEDVIAIGNPLGLDLSGSVTKGIISGKERMIPIDLSGNNQADWQVEVMQTDAAINPGNSGGALMNTLGQLIGINSMKIAESSVEGIGFTIPINEAIPVIEELESVGQVRRAFLGIEAYSLMEVPRNQWQTTLNLPSDVEAGVVLNAVVPQSPADEAGLQALDVIVKLDDTAIETMIDLRKYLYQEKSPGDIIQVTYYRNQVRQTTEFELSTQE
ncbi:putative serine protease YyxA [Halolactibacillus alkaliphilus]|uniref:Putative serine protease YyxA n=1 Tax=Halolactibacillus alkaliphilus TaxID=442899 RepID=A0A511X0G8_9BACI|nr:trypsin-like peptidase domain-containing protein [Halolactibacillus alkaliphilus]GEN56443.1 putative serine protease YyxA [Halolactibacillus alkaliphilus]GGN64407.1 putative serine protease YyxA [Halolactibacillus alkaliphilus]SFO61149.1 serine protease Do [Halolactibacillus alkaliphilus]